MTFYRRDLPHLQRDGKPHFITFATHKRWVLPEIARDITLRSCLHEHGARMLTVWQEESFDRVLRSSEKLDQKIAYLLDNPVRRGLASRTEDYKWLWREQAELRSAAQPGAAGPT